MKSFLAVHDDSLFLKRGVNVPCKEGTTLEPYMIKFEFKCYDPVVGEIGCGFLAFLNGSVNDLKVG